MNRLIRNRKAKFSKNIPFPLLRKESAVFRKSRKSFLTLTEGLTSK